MKKKIGAMALVALLALALAAYLASGTKPGTEAAYARVDPEMLGPLRAVPSVLQNAALNDWSVPVFRLVQSRMNRPIKPSPAPQPAFRQIPGPAGAPPVGVLVIDPTPGGQRRPALLHMHGGGYVMGSPWQRPADLQLLAMQCGCVLVSVDYRLAPEAVFPAALEDNYAALSWLHDNADALGVDRHRIAIGGESAGGGHAAALALAARDRGRIPVLFQLLIYPMLDDRTGSSRAAPANTGDFIWTAARNQFGWSALLGKPAGSEQVPTGAVPARADKLAGLPPAFIGVGELDLFADENLAYAQRLRAAGVAVELARVPGAFHGFDVIAPEASASVRFKAQWLAALKAAFDKR